MSSSYSRPTMISNHRPKKRPLSRTADAGPSSGSSDEDALSSKRPGKSKGKAKNSNKKTKRSKSTTLTEQEQQQRAELEASLFGGLFAGAGAGASTSSNVKGKGRAAQEDDESDDEDEVAGGPAGSSVRLIDRDELREREELAELEDDQLFTIDGGMPEDAAGDSASETDYEADDVLRDDRSGEDSEDDEEEGETGASSAEEVDLEADEDEEEHEPKSALSSASQQAAPAPAQSKARRLRAVWTDPDDARLTIALSGASARAADGTFAGTKRLRRLRKSAEESEVTGSEYERRLREMFEKLHPRPVWALRSLRKAALAAAQQQGLDEIQNGKAPYFEEEARAGGKKSSAAAGPSLRDLLSQEDTGLLRRLGVSKGKARLAPGTIEMERLKNANEAQHVSDEAAIEALAFHPSARTAVLLTASRDRRIRLFSITGGSANPLLQTLHIPDMPVKTALFIGGGAGSAGGGGGSSVLISGERPFLYSWDLQSGRILRSNPWRAGAAATAALDVTERDLSTAVAQPHYTGGSLVAFKGRRGVVNLIDWGRSGAGSASLVASLRSSGTLAGLAWDHSSALSGSGGGDGRSLVTLSTGGEFNAWDTRNLRCSVVKRDLGLFRANSLQCSPDGSYWTVGSDDGIVNVYESGTLLQGAATTGAGSAGNSWENDADAVKVLQGKADVAAPISSVKTIENLTTSITTQRFNHDAQLLAIASRNKKDAMRLVHFPTMRTFANWPTSGTPLGHVTAVDFNATGRFLAVGNSRGRVLLYSPKHYA